MAGEALGALDGVAERADLVDQAVALGGAAGVHLAAGELFKRIGIHAAALGGLGGELAVDVFHHLFDGLALTLGKLRD